VVTVGSEQINRSSLLFLTNTRLFDGQVPRGRRWSPRRSLAKLGSWQTKSESGFGHWRRSKLIHLPASKSKSYVAVCSLDVLLVPLEQECLLY
jgi:hypothetical protein